MNKRATPSLTANILRSDADVVEAIHVVQTEMGITGTTAKEASETIQGSLAATAAAWQNLVVGLSNGGNGLDALINDVVDSAITAFGNILPVVLMVLESIGTAIQDFAPVFAETLPTLIEDVLPSMLEAGVSLVAALVSGLGSALPYGTLSLTLNNATRRFDPGAKDSIFRSLEERQTIKVYMGVTLPDESAALAPVGAYYQYQNGNPIVDILLGEKLGLAKEIAAEVSLILPKPCGIDDFDLCVLFANALDNAIEAARQVPDQSERTVALTIRRIHQMLVIKVENSFAAALVQENGQLKTTKAGGGLHGWGLKSAQTAAEKYDGMVQTNVSGEIFRAVATLSYQGMEDIHE